MFKCRDAVGGITYSNIACEKQGLLQVGEVPERISVLPGTAPAAKASKADETKRDNPNTGSMLKPVNPIIERLLK